MPTPDTYREFENDHRDPQLVAAMAIIDQLEEVNHQLRRLNKNE